MLLHVGDLVKMRKPHPCGKKDSKCFEVLRVGIDFKIKCLACGHEIMLPRVKAEKNIRRVIRQD